MAIIFLIVLISSPWIWKIASVNILVLIAIFATSFLLSRNIENKKNMYLILAVSFLVLAFFQYRTTNLSSLSELSEVEKTVQIQRMREYPNPRIAHIVEERPESIVLRRLQENFFENLDINLYFFGNHPRSRVGYDEFEKFSYIFLPFFAVGLIRILDERKLKEIGIFLVIPLILFSVIGNKNPIGPFLLFPFFAVTISKGIYEIFRHK